MSAISSIEWTDRTWNPIRGCSVVSPGCVNCYAMKFAHRFSGPGKPYEGLTKQTKAGPQWTGKVRLVDEVLTEPLRWKKPARVFVNSMSDLFHEAVPDAFIADVFATMARAPQHTFQILTKRPERMAAWMQNGAGWMTLAVNFSASPIPGMAMPWPLPNVWLGVSVENQATADVRIPLLLQTPASVRFVSYEPALEPVDFTELPSRYDAGDGQGVCNRPLLRLNALKGGHWCGGEFWPSARLDWVIVGGESGPCARPFDVEWARSAVAQCKAAGTAVFVKQLGAVPLLPDYALSGDTSRAAYERERADILTWPSGTMLGNPTGDPRLNGRVFLLRDRKGGDPSEWPEDLRVREFPGVRP